MRITSAIGGLALLTVLATQPPSAGGADGDDESRSSLEFHISEEVLFPDNLEIAPGQAFVFSNESASVANIEFVLDPGETIPCVLDDGNKPFGRNLILGSGDSIRCTPPVSGAYEFSVLRKDGRSTGRIVVR